ncbi:MAG: sugar:sodium symporter, partial [Oscillospiraceae bacterium]|nr:sugar:sodium symporter [Oscillospiraceae bacterium]
NTDETGTVAAQSSETLLGLRLMMTILPMIVLAIALILFSKKFTLTDQRVKEIGEELKAKENGNG